MARRKGRNRKTLKQYIKIYVEGETEENYLLSLARKHRIRLSIEPEFLNNLSKNPNILNIIYKNLQKDVKNISVKEIHLTLELDHYLNTNNTTYINKIQNFIKKVKQLGINNIYLINPCIELWFLFHFQFTDKQFRNCDEVINYIKNNLCSILNNFIKNLENNNWVKINYHHIFYGDIDNKKIDILRLNLADFKNKFCQNNKFNYEKNNDEFLSMLIDLGLEKFAINNGKRLKSFSFKEKNTSLEIYKLIEYILNNFDN